MDGAVDDTRTTRSRWLGPAFRPPGRRLVSLVPSLTLAVFELGAGDRLVGRTRFCVEPRPAVERIPTVGGTKSVHPDDVLALEPDVVLANREENVRERVEVIARRVPVWLSDLRGPEDVPPVWRELGAICGMPADAERRARELETALPGAGAPAAGEEGRGSPAGGAAGPGFVYWVWQDPWMAAGHDTYISRLLVAAGWRNVLPPGVPRYPRLGPRDAAALRPDAMLFPDEPYAFSLPVDLEAFGRSASADGRIWRVAGGPAALAVSGRTFGWYPTHTLHGLERARRLRLALGR